MAQPHPPQAPGQGEPLHMLSHSIRRIEMELTANNLPSKVRQFTGESHKQFRQWLKDMDRVGDHVRHDLERMKRLTIDTLKGHAAEYFHRFLRERPNPTWEEIKEIMCGRYYDLADREYAKQQLKTVKQHSGEAIQHYADRLQELADQVYSSEELEHPLVHATLKDQFVAGVRDDSVARQLLKHRPQTLAHAVELAMQVSQTSKLFQLMRSNEEPMDVSAVDKQTTGGPYELKGRSDKRCLSKEELNSKLDQALREINEVAKVTADYIGENEKRMRNYYSQTGGSQQFQGSNPYYQNQTRSQTFNRSASQTGPRNEQQSATYRMGAPVSRRDQPLRWASDGRPICRFCGITGHIQRECRKRMSQRQPLN